jgi:murein L,D-transpeptidase YcbB/YkuD
LNDVRHGAIDPRRLGVGHPASTSRDEVVSCLRDAVDRGPIADALQCARPVMEEYELLRSALTRYRTLTAIADAWTSPTDTIHPGDRFAGAVRLRVRLIAFGDLPSAESGEVDPGVYSGALVEGVKRFQSRHGLDVDGVIGRATWGELSVPPAQRARQIELALERLRWLPREIDAPLLVLNVPMFELRAWDHGWRGDPAFTMKAIVGRPVTPTPAFSKTIKSVIFRPYWNVPRSILRQELLPALEKDPGLLGRDDMEIVRGEGDDADVVAATKDNLEQLARGALRLRQRPGPKNALGFIKFMLPNEEQVYLHGTPAQRLFARSRRAFSHGCVRVEDAVALAEWVFMASGEWSRKRILETISNPAVVSRKVRLQRQIHVIFVYTTAGATPDGAVRFAPDIYSQDAALDRALRGRP